MGIMEEEDNLKLKKITHIRVGGISNLDTCHLCENYMGYSDLEDERVLIYCNGRCKIKHGFINKL